VSRRKTWSKVREEALGAVVRERDVGYLDPGIADVLNTLNSLGKLATTSSCNGRIAFVEGKVHWGRDRESRIVYKTHGRIIPEDILRIISRGFRDLWLKATGPIMHVRTNDFDCAMHLLEKARENGFKHSGIISHGNPGGIVVELMSANQMSTPLVADGAILVKLGSRQLSVLAEKANRTVEEGRRRLAWLVEDLARNPGFCG
jgi:tRNA wybutosine-synthesizing protein 3